MSSHGAAVLKVARKYSRSVADAEDAYQRTFEKCFVKPPKNWQGDDPLPWLLTVARNEALMIRRKQSGSLEIGYDDACGDWADIIGSPADRVVEIESARIGSEALLRINPDQARCLLLRADGLSYKEIAAETGFTYGKVQSALIEGRRVYRGLLDRIDTGAECRRLEPVLSKLVDGELAGVDREDAELHLRNCGACRAVTRDFAAAPREVALLFPVAAATGGVIESISDKLSAAAAWFNDRVPMQLPNSPVAELAFGKKLALATAAAGTIVAGGAGVHHAASGRDRAAGEAAAVKAASAAALQAKPALSGEPANKSERKKPKRSKRVRRVTAGELLSTGGSADPGAARSADTPDPAPRFVDPGKEPTPDSPDATDPSAEPDLPTGDLPSPSAGTRTQSIPGVGPGGWHCASASSRWRFSGFRSPRSREGATKSTSAPIRVGSTGRRFRMAFRMTGGCLETAQLKVRHTPSISGPSRHPKRSTRKCHGSIPTGEVRCGLA